MQEYINFGWGTGFAVIMGFVLIILLAYTIVKLRKQVSGAKKREQEKKSGQSDLSKKK